MIAFYDKTASNRLDILMSLVSNKQLLYDFMRKKLNLI